MLGVSYLIFPIGFVAFVIAAYLWAAVTSAFARSLLQRWFKTTARYSELCPCVFGGVFCSGLLGLFTILAGLVTVDQQGHFESAFDLVILGLINLLVTPAVATLLLMKMNGKTVFWKTSAAVALSQIGLSLLLIAVVYGVLGIMLVFGQ